MPVQSRRRNPADPSPRAIRRLAREIQRTWTRREREIRSDGLDVCRPDHWRGIDYGRVHSFGTLDGIA